MKTRPAPPAATDSDLIGPPNSTSNLRLTIYHIPENATTLHKEYIKRRQAIFEWNHEFWSNHNQEFAKEKQKFTGAKLEQLGPYYDDGTKRTLTAEQMAEFYKKFLERKFVTMEEYNHEWYKKNNRLTLLALRVNLQRLWLGALRLIRR